MDLQRLLTPERAPVGGLDVAHRRVLEDGAEDAVDELGLEVPRVRVHEHHEVAAGHGEGAPHRVALAVGAAVLAHQVVLREDLRALPGGDGGRAVGGVGVYDQDLVDQEVPARAAVYRVDLVDDPADGVGDVARGQHGADREAPLALPAAQLPQVREALEVIRAMLKPIPGVHVLQAPSLLPDHSPGTLSHYVLFVQYPPEDLVDSLPAAPG